MTIVIGIVIGLITPLLLGGTIENLLNNENKYGIYRYIMFLTIIGFLQIVVNTCNQVINIKLNNQIVNEVKMDMYSKILVLPMKYFDEISVGEFISRIEGDVNELINIITNDFVNCIIDILTTIIIGVIVFKINIILGFIVLIGFPCTYYIFKKFGIKLRKESSNLKKLNDRYYGILQQSLSGIKYIKINRLRDENFSYYKSMNEKMKCKRIHISLLRVVSNVFSQIINEIDTVLVLCVGVFYVKNGSLSVQLFIAFIAYAGQFSGSLQKLTSMNITIQQSLVTLERIFGIIDNLIFEKETIGNKYIEYNNEEIQFKNVQFSYDKKKNVFSNLNININYNGLSVIMGKSGSGKSTILSLLSGIYKVDKGEISIANVNINKLNDEFFKKSISFIPQNPFLFNLTIRENFKLVVPEATEKEIIQVCEKTCIYDYIKSLDKKFDTVIEDNLSNLSYGQKQRISLAICLLKNTPIILLDEITVGLDVESKEVIMKSILEISKNKKVIMVSHDMDMKNYTDNILYLRNGNIYDMKEGLITKI